MGLLDSLKIDKPDSFDLTEVLDYTPENLSPLYQKFQSKENRGVGFQKTVKQKFNDFEGLGPGSISIRDDKEKGVVTTWSPYMGNEWVDEQNQKLDTAEKIMNAPLALAPLVPIVAGAKAIGRQRDFAKTGAYTQGTHRKYPFPEEGKGKIIDLVKRNQATTEHVFSLSGVDFRAYKRAAHIYRNHEGGISWKRAMEIAKRGKGPTMADGDYNYLPNFYDTSDDALISLNKDLKASVPGDPSDYYPKHYKFTTQKDLDLYAKPVEEFTLYGSFDSAVKAGERAAEGKKRWAGLDVQIGNGYFKVYKSLNKIKILPYNKWYQKTKNPFKVPPNIIKSLKKNESFQGELYSKNNQLVRYNEGTVDRFVDYVNTEILWQTEQQRLMEDAALALYKDLGIKHQRGKTVFSEDKSHAVARSEGGPGYTFLEAWWSNQMRGSAPILDDQTLVDLGIPRNWKEYFERWYQEQGEGSPATDLGKLADISWDDYSRAQSGVDINEIKIDRNAINHLIQRQIADPTTINQPGKLGDTIGDDFEILVRRTKGYRPDEDIIEISGEAEFDLEWRAKTFGEAQKLKEQTKQAKIAEKNKKLQTRESKKRSTQSQRETTLKEKKGQGKIFDVNQFLDKELPDRNL